jgi:hypothetical protein
MRDPLPPFLINDDEVLARFVFFPDWIRSDGTLRQDAFIPPKDLQLSITRHTGLSAGELWAIAQKVAEQRILELLGRADLVARDVTSTGLTTQSVPLPENPNHAHVTGWPQDKPSRKSLAQQLAAMAKYVPKP